MIQFLAVSQVSNHPPLGENGQLHMNVPLQVNLHTTRTIQYLTVLNCYIFNTVLVKSFAYLMLLIFCDPPERGGLKLSISPRKARKKFPFKCVKFFTKTVHQGKSKIKPCIHFHHSKIKWLPCVFPPMIKHCLSFEPNVGSSLWAMAILVSGPRATRVISPAMDVIYSNIQYITTHISQCNSNLTQVLCFIW